MQPYNGRHYVALVNLQTTSGLSILLHGVISLPDTRSCDKLCRSCHLTPCPVHFVCMIMLCKNTFSNAHANVTTRSHNVASLFSLADKWFYAAGKCFIQLAATGLGATYEIFTFFLKEICNKCIRRGITIFKIFI